MEKIVKTFYPENPLQWRMWLQENHAKEESVWLIYYKKKTNVPSITWSEAVDEALCFGWIDSLAKPVDEDRYMQFFSRRKANSTWSGINKEKIRKLTAEGLMVEAGLDCVETAKQNGTWTILDEVEALVIPTDLEEAFQNAPDAKSYFLTLSKSDKRHILHWIVFAKREDTRQKRIAEIIGFTSQNLKPKIIQWTKKN